MAERDLDQRRSAAARDLAGGVDARIEIVTYDPAWPPRFDAEAERLARIVPDIRWHHIGSTAVPGLAAKAIIDMMARADDVDAPIRSLVDEGDYAYPAAYNRGLEHRRWLCRPSAAERTYHLHLVADPDELDRHLAFRDALRADPELAGRYARLKLALAASAPHDREGYTEAKSDFVRSVLRGS